MDTEQIIITLTQELAEFRGATNSLKDRLSSLENTIEKVDTRLNKFLLREAEFKGELKGFKRSIIILAALASMTISSIGVAASLYVR